MSTIRIENGRYFVFIDEFHAYTARSIQEAKQWLRDYFTRFPNEA